LQKRIRTNRFRHEFSLRGKVVFEELEKKYEQPIKDMLQHINSSKNASPRKIWTDREKEKWLLREPSCKICKLPFSKINIITKEHIHPLVLGGFETDENIIPLCQKCNEARNLVMTQILGTTSIGSIRKNFPANRQSLIQFILWCHVTIYSIAVEISLFPHLNEAFSRARGVELPTVSINLNPKPMQKDSLRKKFRNIFSRPSGELPMSPIQNPDDFLYLRCQQCQQNLRINKKDSDKTLRCPKCKFEQIWSDKKSPINHEILNSDQLAKLDIESIDLIQLKLDYIQYLKELIHNMKVVKLEEFNQKISDFLKIKNIEKHSELKRLLGFSRTYPLWKMLHELGPNDFETFKDEHDKWSVSLIEMNNVKIHSEQIENTESNETLVKIDIDTKTIDVETLKQEICLELEKKLQSKKSLPLDSIFSIHLKDLLLKYEFKTPTELKSMLGYGKNAALKQILSDIGNGMFAFEQISEKKWVLRLSL
jgi:5-methylcytosine-specific restriction endonuclease McrA